MLPETSQSSDSRNDFQLPSSRVRFENRAQRLVQLGLANTECKSISDVPDQSTIVFIQAFT
ncbi:hypothetical protein DIS09_16020 [Burkholderia pseudomallei]|nr:hypothetical protein AMS56_17160 [Burkholderia pseudomallei]ONF03816.1 hypothetical protein AQ959_02545 [Burkholderia pseudomallei]TPE97631.1 hypothetical protein DIS09_16020 [Burkholderia pseudomallei]